MYIPTFTFVVSRLSSIEVLPCDSSSPISAVTLKLKKIDGKEEDSTINISKDDVQVLLKGIKKWNLVIKK